MKREERDPIRLIHRLMDVCLLGQNKVKIQSKQKLNQRRMSPSKSSKSSRIPVGSADDDTQSLLATVGVYLKLLKSPVFPGSVRPGPQPVPHRDGEGVRVRLGRGRTDGWVAITDAERLH